MWSHGGLVGRSMCMAAITLAATTGPWIPRAPARDVAPERFGVDVRHEPGVSVELYEGDGAWIRFQKPVPGQTPNVSVRRPRVEITSAGVEGYTRRYYVEITADLLVEQAGDYGFQLTSEDPSRLEINGRLVIDNDAADAARKESRLIWLEPGPHPLAVSMFHAEGDQGLKLQWRVPGSEHYRRIPTRSLRTEAGLTRVVSPGPKRFAEEGGGARPGDGRPLEAVHPMWKITTLDPRGPEGFELKIAGMEYLGDGKLALAVFDPRNNGEFVEEPNGRLWILDGVDGDPDAVTVTLAAEGLVNPLGVLHHDGALYVAQRDEITRFVDGDGDDVYEQRGTVASGWISDSYHHFTFGPVFLDGDLYATLSTAIGYGSQKILRQATFGTGPNAAHRGSLMKIDPETGEIDYIAGGLRAPNGLIIHDGELFVGENQGAWQPADKINHLQPGRFYGHYNGNAITSSYPDGVLPSDFADQPVAPPAVYLPHGEIANSPTDAVTLPDGPFKGHLLVSDVKHGGLRRVLLERVNGQYQGVVLRHSQGFNCGLNRLAFGEGGVIYCGGIGERLSWSWRRTTAGLQRLEPTGHGAFEFHDITATPDGLRVRFTRPVPRAMLEDPDLYELRQWRYRPTSAYGGLKFDLERIDVTEAAADDDLLSVTLRIPGIRSGRVIHLRSDMQSTDGQPVWSPEAWYTMNEIPGLARVDPPIPLTRALLFTKTREFRHENIEDGVKAIRLLCLFDGIDIVHTEDAAVFTDDDLARFDVVVFFSTTGDVLDDDQQAAFERFIRGGGGFVGIHAATDTEYDWPWYNGLVGGYFARHPPVQPAEIDVLDHDHPSTAFLPGRWKRTDEWYDFKDMAEGRNVLLNLDESSYNGGKMGADHPIAWYREYDGGRAWYTAGGHTAESFAEQGFLKHLAGGIRWAAGIGAPLDPP